MRFHRFRVVVVPDATIQLNPHQAPLIYATLAKAYGLASNCESVLPNGVLVEAPEQGRVVVEAKQPFAFGWTMLSVDHRDAKLRCQRLVDGLRTLGVRPRHASKPLAGGFEVTEITDVLSGNPINRDFDFVGVDASTKLSIDGKIFSEKTLPSPYSITLRLLTPQRISRPATAKDSGHAFLDPTWFCGWRWLKSLDKRLRDAGLSKLCPDRQHPGVAPIFQNETNFCDTTELTWLDLPYQGEGGSKSLGGIVGTVTISNVDAAWFPALFWGQLIGVGRNTAMGLGRYNIVNPQLRSCESDQVQSDDAYQSLFAPLQRSASLLSYALNPKAIDRGAARYELPVGQAIAAAHAIRLEEYTPDAPTRFTLHDGDKRPRLMSVPSHRDRALQVAVLESIGPAIDRYLETSSFAYRRGLGRHSAAKQITKLTAEGFRWPVRSDIHRFFDTVDHRILRSRIEAYLPDPPLVELLMNWVRASAANASVGLPTGAPVSPVLANLLLDQFDETIERDGARLVRYADDFLILHKTKQQAVAAVETAQLAANQLKLKLNDEKTELYKPDDTFEFLGFRFQRDLDWRFRAAIPQSELDGLGWIDLKDSSREISDRSSLPALPGEKPKQSPSIGSIAFLTPKVARIASRTGELVVFDRVDREIKTLKCRNLKTVLVQRAVNLESSAIEQIIKHDITVLFLSPSGHIEAELRSPMKLGSAESQIAQLQLLQCEDASLLAAKSLVAAKLRNTAASARALIDGQAGFMLSAELRELAERAWDASDCDQLLGFEGAGAAAWYREFGNRLPKEFHFRKRIAPRATDATNAMLNVAHTHIYRVCEAAVVAAGLLPHLGTFHAPRSGHNSLASDMQEPFRHLADRAVWTACIRLSKDDFDYQTNASQPVVIKPRAMRELFNILYRSLSMNCESQNGATGSYRDHIFRQARNYRTWLDHPDQPFTAFEHRE